jgi:hypothetical protein
MPFTLAHPVAALPLRERLGRLGSVPALAIGSMIPDLAYFLPLGVSGAQSHSVPGLLWFCLPAGVLACAIYHFLLRPFVLALAPSAVSARMGPRRSIGWSWATMLQVAISVIVGASTHLAWDSFTHSTGAMVQALPVLRRPVLLFPFYSPYIFTILQHGSTVIGMSTLAFWSIRWFHRT